MVVETASEFVALDPATRRNLEITATLSGGESPTLFSLLDHCATAAGSRLLRHWLTQRAADSVGCGLADGVAEEGLATKRVVAEHLAALIHEAAGVVADLLVPGVHGVTVLVHEAADGQCRQAGQ